ncbi:MAG: HEPN domain-containing protein [Bacteroides sp.]|nr:HEPN domain-containing protein [Bacteroides sp.]
MSLSEEERNALVTLQMEKAKRFLQQANEMYDMKYWDIASNRYYYACFHAVQALLIKNGLNCRTHDGLISCFGLNFVKTGKVDSTLGSFLSRMEQLRQKGDYNCIYSVAEDEVATMRIPASQLINRIEELLSKS